LENGGNVVVAEHPFAPNLFAREPARAQSISKPAFFTGDAFSRLLQILENHRRRPL
jgi:hypothetical protein